MKNANLAFFCLSPFNFMNNQLKSTYHGIEDKMIMIRLATLISGVLVTLTNI